MSLGLIILNSQLQFPDKWNTDDNESTHPLKKKKVPGGYED